MCSIPGDGYIEKKFLLKNEDVGDFEFLMLIPDYARDKYPCIIGLHGHFHAPSTIADQYMGAELAKKGFIVLIPYFRVMEHDNEEMLLSVKLLENGFTLMGLRVYEVMLLLEYARRTEIIDAGRIGLISHSGGSTVANLAVHLTDLVSAQVTDYYSNYLDCRGDNEFIHCETVPGLHAYMELINSGHDLKFPVFKANYGFESKDERRQIMDYFLTRLGENTVEKKQP